MPQALFCSQIPSLALVIVLITIVCVTHSKDGKMSSVSIPPEIAELIEEAPSELLKS